jgi:ankyrin repeat protein
MFYAAPAGNVQVMRYLLDHGADPAMPQERGSTPLHNAAEEGGISHASFSFLSVLGI